MLRLVLLLKQSASQRSDMLDKLAADREDVSLVVIKALRDELETCFMAEISVLLLP